MDFAAIIKAPMQDKEWLSKCVVMGLLCLVPIVGLLNLLGWTKATYANAKAGNLALPPAGFGYVGAGWALFLAVLPLILAMIALAVGVGIFTAVLGGGALAALLNLGVQLVSLAMSLVVGPTLIYRHVVHGKGFGDALDLAGIARVITSNTSLFVTFALISFVGHLISSLGLMACCIGIFVSAPFAQAIQANAIASFEKANGGL